MYTINLSYKDGYSEQTFSNGNNLAEPDRNVDRQAAETPNLMAPSGSIVDLSKARKKEEGVEDSETDFRYDSRHAETKLRVTHQDSRESKK